MPAGSGPLAFAKCMRANGVAGFPDPQPGSGALFPISSGVDQASPAFRTAQARCSRYLQAALPGGGGHPSAQTMAKLVRIAQCMRAHGIPQFPDPQTSRPADMSRYREITDFDGAILAFPPSIDMQAPAYAQALKACGAPPLGLPH